MRKIETHFRARTVFALVTNTTRLRRLAIYVCLLRPIRRRRDGQDYVYRDLLYVGTISGVIDNRGQSAGVGMVSNI